jgi:lysophospholipase L1-like esterase
MTRRRGAPVALAVLALLAGGCRRSWTITNAYPSGANVIAFGDSLTEGYRVGPGEGWPEQLSAIVGRPILNRGVSGNTTGDALARLERDVLAQDPRVVLVCLGGNDMLRRMPADQQFDNLRTIVRRIQDKGALVVLIGTEGFKILRRVDYGDRYEALARETGAVYVPDLMKGVLADPGLMTDQIHPNARGYAKIARRIADEAGEYLAR